MKRFGLGLLQSVGSGLRFLLIAVITVAVGTGVIAVANYAVTQGSGTNFASLVISTVHYAAMVICDATAGQSQCGAVKAGNTAATTDVAQVVADPNLLAAINGSIPAGTNAIGSVQTQTLGSKYATIAASQTAQALTGGGGGATGDYLSHCVVYPTSTSPGVLTVFDNTSTAGNNAIAFPGGATSTSNLVPFAVPVGAVSVNGPWKVTTGANMVATCYGKFT